MLEKLVAELRQIMPFKETTEVGDLVLLAADNPQMLVYALVMAIESDSSRRGGWWHVSLQLLTVPPQHTVWTLRPPQFTGKEIFTMGGDQRFLQAVSMDFAVDLDQEEENREASAPSTATKKPFKRIK